MATFILDVHIAAGTLAFLAMILPLVSAKGSSLHRRAGWVFWAGMGMVCLTALLLSGIRLVTDHSAAGRNFSLLLIYVAILTGSCLWAGIRVVQTKDRTTPGTWRNAAHATLLASAGALALVYGLITTQLLFMVFGSIGALNGLGGIAYWRRAPRRMEWWLAHMANMLGACITATTAFFLAGARHIGLRGDSIELWLAPTVVGLPLIAIWVRHYVRLFRRSTVPSHSLVRNAESHGSTR
jgi:uncharacterized membrane protein